METVGELTLRQALLKPVSCCIVPHPARSQTLISLADSFVVCYHIVCCLKYISTGSGNYTY